MMSKKQDLLAEKERLQKELTELGSVAETQVWHKKARIQQIDEEIKKLETGQFNSGADKLKEKMQQQDMERMLAAQGQGRE